MRSYSLNFFVLAVFSIVGCGGETHPSPEQTPGWNPVEAYVKAIKGEVTILLAVAAENPQEVAGQADATLESFDDAADAGQYAATITQIKQKVKELAAGSGNIAELKELVATLPGETPALVQE